MLLTITEAAKAAGVARSTIYDRVKAGELSRGAHGKIDTAELLRVFGPLAAAPDAADPAAAEPESAHAAWLRELVDRQAAIIERQGADLREAEARAERREATWARQLDRLTALLPAPTSVEPAPASPRRLWRLLFD